MKKFLSIILCIMSVACLMSCNNPEAKSGSATAYGVTTGACPVKVEIKVDGDGKVGDVKINEYLSAYDIGKLSANKKYGVEIVEREDGYAKYLMIGDRKFEFTGGRYFCDDLVGTEKSFDAYMATDEGAEWYIEQVNSGNFNITDERGMPYNVSFDMYDGYKLDKEIWANKLKNGYHEGVEYDDGWKENIYNLVVHIKNHGFYDYKGTETPSGKKKTFKVGKYDTLVNLSNFHDYMIVANKAYVEAKKNVK